MYRHAALDRLLPGLVHGFSGALPPGEPIAAAARRLLGPRGAAAPPVLELGQPHSPHLADLTAAEAPADPPVAEGSWKLKGVDGAHARAAWGPVIAIKTADCVPVLAVDPERGRYAALHAGWRGIAGGILPNLLRAWAEGGSSLEAVRLVLGPAIQRCCYEVGEDCLAHFAPEHLVGAVAREGPRPHLDLGAVLRAQAAAHGLGPHQVAALPYCTACYREAGAHPFASYRRERRAGRPGGVRNVSFVGVLVPGE